MDCTDLSLFYSEVMAWMNCSRCDSDDYHDSVTTLDFCALRLSRQIVTQRYSGLKELQAQYAMHECNDNQITHCYLNGPHRSTQPTAYTREQLLQLAQICCSTSSPKTQQKLPENSNLPRHPTTQLKSELIKPTAYGQETQASHNYTTEHSDVLSMQMGSDLVIYRTILVRTFQVKPEKIYITHSIVFTVKSFESITNGLLKKPFENIDKCCKPAAASAWIVVEILGVHTSEACVIGCVEGLYKSNLLVIPSEEEEGETYKKEDRYNRDDNNDDRNVERSKERSKDRRMRMRSDKKPSRKNDRKVLMAEESTKSWADSDSESSSSSSSSSDSEQEEVHCLMTDQMADDEVFDFYNVEFTREDLVAALNDMVKEYRKLSHSFEEAKAENMSLKSSSIESSYDELEDIDSLKTELSKLTAENDVLKNETSELKA
ncbi:hypothetical protein F511_23546 [Dorcoceras hygrometricum]|uniref:Uncharacterized protein n=1 Tax=Dorcoceras hygrometricum TaxID=472368 RepID=A0A2Z7B5Y5_9LAMI|nr:hypothetical protein F511_23546 [Dorcoceras hygrometricum]